MWRIEDKLGAGGHVLITEMLFVCDRCGRVQSEDLKCKCGGPNLQVVPRSENVQVVRYSGGWRPD